MSYHRITRRGRSIGRVGLFLYTPGAPQFNTAPPTPTPAPAVPSQPDLYIRTPVITLQPGAPTPPGDAPNPPVAVLTTPGGNPTPQDVLSDWLGQSTQQFSTGSSTADTNAPALTGPVSNADGSSSSGSPLLAIAVGVGIVAFIISGSKRK
jgi:hypothetical protein